MLGLCTTPKMDINASLAEMVMRQVPLLPSELICHGPLATPLSAPLTRHHCSHAQAMVPTFVSVDYAFVHIDAHCNLLQPLYLGPFKVIC